MAFIEMDESTSTARIKVVGVGGGGGNAVNTMIASGLEGVEFIAANTDIQALESNLAGQKLQLGLDLTRGLGAGANPEVGHNAALENTDEVREMLGDADMVFVAAGMGGGTGTGAAPVIAKVARELGALTVGVVTKPFRFEGGKRSRQAEAGIAALQQEVDTLITIPNQRLLSVAGQATSMLDAFRKVDEVLLNAVQGISDLVVIHGFINVDFADVRTVMAERGQALMGTGYAAGDRKALEAAKQAIASPLLEDANIMGATGILINITGGPDLTLMEIDEATTLIMEAADPDANIIFGSVIDANLEDQVRITVIATGFDAELRNQVEQTSGGHSIQGNRGQGMAASGHSQMAAPRETVAAREPVYAQAANTPAKHVTSANATIPVAPARVPPTPILATETSETTPHAQSGMNHQPMAQAPQTQPMAAQPIAAQGKFFQAAPMAAPQASPQQQMQMPLTPMPTPAPMPTSMPTPMHQAVPETTWERPQGDPRVTTGQFAATQAEQPAISIEAQPPGRRPRRTTGQVPLIHPTLGGAMPDEQEMDIPTFLRRKVDEP